MLAKCPMATMVLVTEVPMLAPMIMKMAMLTESSSAPTMETMIEVVVEEDWTSTVASTPIRRAEIGLSATSNILAESLPPRSLKPVPMMERVRRNTQSSRRRDREDGLLDGVLIEGVSHLACAAWSAFSSVVISFVSDLGEDALLGSLGLGVGGVLHVLDEVTLVDLEAVVLPDQLLCGSETEKHQRRSATRDAMAG